MSEKKFSKGSEEWTLFMDYWALCQELWIPEDAEVYWANVRKRAEEFCRKHPDNFARGLISALQNDLMEKSR